MTISIVGSFQFVLNSGNSKTGSRRVVCDQGGDFPKLTIAVKSSMNVLALLALTTIAPTLPHFGQRCANGGRSGGCLIIVQAQKSHSANCRARRPFRLANLVIWGSGGCS